ncbi:MAG: hypothetical protein AAF789_05520 [Bacteroidota bacterium]
MTDILLLLQTSAVFGTLICGVIITIRSLYGYFADGRYTKMDSLFALLFIILLYTQFAAEIVIFFTSKFKYEEGLTAVEHILLTLVATLLATAGRFISKRSGDDAVKFRFRSLFYGMATCLLIYGFVLVAG